MGWEHLQCGDWMKGWFMTGQGRTEPREISSCYSEGTQFKTHELCISGNFHFSNISGLWVTETIERKTENKRGTTVV